MAEKTIETNVEKTGHIKDCKLLYMRDAASVEGTVLCVLDKKSTFKILDRRDEYFYKVEYKDMVGFCMKQFVEEK